MTQRGFKAITAAKILLNVLALAGDSTITNFLFIVPNLLLPYIPLLLPEPEHNSLSPPALPSP